MTRIPAVQIPTQTHSSLETAATCLRMYEAKHKLYSVKFKETYESKWGNDAHHHLEMYVAAGALGESYRIPQQIHRETGQDMRDYQWVGDALLERAARRGGKIMAERKFGIGLDGTSNNYFDKFGFLRGKIDVTIVYPQLQLAEVFDHKTGKRKSDPGQLNIYGASAILDYPEVQTVKSAYIWLKLPPGKAIDPPITISRQGMPNLMQEFSNRYRPVYEAWQKNQFPPSPGPLCGWCDVESCEFWKPSPKRNLT